MKLCVCVGAGEFFGLPAWKEEPSFVVAADGGWEHLRRVGRLPDLLIGDLDSLETPPPPSVPLLRHPVEKDDTDMLLAVKEGLRRGCDTFFLLGGTGGRLDHTLANLQTLAFLHENGCRGWLFDRKSALTATKSLRLPADLPFAAGTGTLSVFAFGGRAADVTLTGLHYPLSGADLTPSFPLGVSNHWNGGNADVRCKSGCLLVSVPLSES